MLSYMVPSGIEEKPPPPPQRAQNGGVSGGPAPSSVISSGIADTLIAAASSSPTRPPKRTIIKTHSKNSTMSHESSASSISSVLSEVPPTHDKSSASKPKINGAPAKHPTLKRVSFGSSKGSMVETLIYESPLQEEPEPTENSDNGSVAGEKASKVKVSFFECDRPVAVSSPEPPSDLTILDAPPCSMTDFARQTSTESGWDNPFRPDGDLSREADEIVELIKGGKPITPTSTSPPSVPAEKSATATNVSNLSAVAGSGPQSQAANGTVTNGAAPGSPRTAEIKCTTAQPPNQPEHVTLKKKPKSKCCSIQ